MALEPFILETAGVIPFSFCGVSFAAAKESLNDLSAV
jgi:hypothetical protein